MIGGRWVSPLSGQFVDLINPSDSSELCDIALGGAEDIDLAVASANASLQGEWGRATAVERGRVLSNIGDIVLQNINELSELEAMDVGKPLKQARADVVALARYMEFYAGAADKLHGQTIPYLDGYTVYTLREPYGVTGHIIPW
ncbi:MAG: aldehyde dehydrogenase family protein, partial [Lentilitoribacter sp.]